MHGSLEAYQMVLNQANVQVAQQGDNMGFL